jgi:hypothetical protein
MRVQPLVDKDELSKNKIYTIYRKYSDGSISIKMNNKFINLKSHEFKIKA